MDGGGEFTWPDGRKYVVIISFYILLRVNIQKIKNKDMENSHGLMVENI